MEYIFSKAPWAAVLTVYSITDANLLIQGMIRRTQQRDMDTLTLLEFLITQRHNFENSSFQKQPIQRLFLENSTNKTYCLTKIKKEVEIDVRFLNPDNCPFRCCLRTDFFEWKTTYLATVSRKQYFSSPPPKFVVEVQYLNEIIKNN